MPRPEAIGVPSNWGRWGDDDERGTANLLREEIVRDAAARVRRGAVYSLAAPLSPDGPNLPSRRQTWHVVTSRQRPDGALSSADDMLMMHTHGTTHVDALCHIFMGDTLYNGHPASGLLPGGAERCGIENAGPMVSRGVLLDIAAFRGVPHLGDGEAIEPDELEACAEAAGGRIAGGRHRAGAHGLVAAFRARDGGAATFLRLRAGIEWRVRPVVPGARFRGGGRG